mmetsp:Transcript_1465/g.3012  ORF Transcript_1465/g.3012 Transcript_1465/m.3012 type:complete len:309 (-) Transcript_1465:504-1430(-)
MTQTATTTLTTATTTPPPPLRRAPRQLSARPRSGAAPAPTAAAATPSACAQAARSCRPHCRRTSCASTACLSRSAPLRGPMPRSSSRWATPMVTTRSTAIHSLASTFSGRWSLARQPWAEASSCAQYSARLTSSRARCPKSLYQSRRTGAASAAHRCTSSTRQRSRAHSARHSVLLESQCPASRRRTRCCTASRRAPRRRCRSYETQILARVTACAGCTPRARAQATPAASSLPRSTGCESRRRSSGRAPTQTRPSLPPPPSQQPNSQHRGRQGRALNGEQCRPAWSRRGRFAHRIRLSSSGQSLTRL